MNPPQTIRAVIFDADGLLFETDHVWAAAETALAERHGRTLTPDDRVALLGASVDQAGSLIAQAVGRPADAETLSRELHKLLLNDLSDAVTIRPGARRLVSALDGRVKLAVASNTPQDVPRLVLKRSGFANDLSVVVSRDDVGNPKPEPDIYELACTRLGVEPKDAVVLEDSAKGVDAAQAAGIFTIGVPTSPNVDIGADIVAESLLDDAVYAALGLRRPLSGMAPGQLPRLYEENAKVAAVFWDWRNKLMAFCASVATALFAISGWLFTHGLRGFASLPLLIGVAVTLRCVDLEYRNTWILGQTYRVGAAIEERWNDAPLEAPAVYRARPWWKPAPPWTNWFGELPRPPTHDGGIFSALDAGARRYFRVLRNVFVAIAVVQLVGAGYLIYLAIRF